MRASFFVLGSLLLATQLSSCTTEAVQTSRLDSSGLTVVTHHDAMTLARPVRTLAAGARDFAYVGPVEINRMGHRDYYLWIGLASTVDRDLVGLVPDIATTLLLVVDDEPMLLPLSEWDTNLDQPPYEATVPLYAAMMAPMSLDQIHRIADAESLEIHVIADTDVVARYRAWAETWSAWSQFPDED